MSRARGLLAAVLLAALGAGGGCCGAPYFAAPLPLEDGARIVETIEPCSKGYCFIKLSLNRSDAAREWGDQLLAIGTSARAPAPVTPTPLVRWRVWEAGTLLRSGESTGKRFGGASGPLRAWWSLEHFPLEPGRIYRVEVTVKGADPRYRDADPILVIQDTQAGWSAFRARVGFGLGIGAQVQASGLLHGGLMLGGFAEAGPGYDAADSKNSAIYLALGPLHEKRFGFIERPASRHFCLGLLPGPLRSVYGDKNTHPWAIEVGVALVFFDLQIGFDPESLLFHE